jgi:hypothetical protein
MTSFKIEETASDGTLIVHAFATYQRADDVFDEMIRHNKAGIKTISADTVFFRDGSKIAFIDPDWKRFCSAVQGEVCIDD